VTHASQSRIHLGFLRERPPCPPCLRGAIGLVVFLLFAVGCKPAPEKAGASRAGDPGKGKQAYLANCIACHATDPSKDGPLGPAILGSSLPLIEARVMRAEYPAGYAPKRGTKTMQPLPFLKPSLPDLAAYLAGPAPVTTTAKP